MKNWFTEQIQQRELSDRRDFEESFERIAGAVMGQDLYAVYADQWTRTRDAIGEILRYYHVKETEIPDEEKDLEEILSYYLRPHGIMWRTVELKKGWSKDASGAMLGMMKEGKAPVALIPNSFLSYHFTDPKNGIRTTVTGKTEQEIDGTAIVFYKSFPMRPLKMIDLFKFIIANIRKADLVRYLVFALVTVLIGMLSPRLVNILFSDVKDSGSLGMLLAIATFMLSLSVSTLLFQAVQNLLVNRIETWLDVAVESATMMRILSLPPSFFKKYASGELANRMAYIGQLVQQLVSVVLSTGLTSLFSLIYITQVFEYAPGLVTPALSMTLLTIIITTASTFMQIGITQKKMELASKENGMSFALISGVQKIRLAGAEQRAFSRWGKLYAQEAGYEYNPPLFLKISNVLVTAVSLIGTIVIYYLAVRTGVSEADYYSFDAAFGMVSGAFTTLSGSVLAIAGIKPTLEMVRPIFEAEPEVAEGKPLVTSLSGSIELSNVTFRYQEGMPRILNNVSLKIRAGQYVAIVGKTGCGKSTLMRILLGFEKPQRGAVYYDGKDLSTMDLRSLRKKIGTVMQSGRLFSGDIYANISISAPNLTMDEAWEAAEVAGLADDIRDMPMGMFTMLSEGEGGVSGGQRQRLMIARAVAPKPKILMFDEATSALDNLTQKKVSDALDRLKCTRIVIAHRLSTIKNCDRIIVLDGGRIVEDGTYEELIQKNGFFSELVARQQVNQVGKDE